MEKLSNWKTKTILFLVSQCISLFGSTLVQMAIVWYVTLKTSCGMWVAVFSICSYLPQFIVSFYGGVWADKYNRKKLIIGADIFIASVTFLMMLLLPQIHNNTTVLVGLLCMSVLRSVGAGIQTPAVGAMIPQLVQNEQFMKYNGINATMQSLVQLAAPAVAGLVLVSSSFRFTLFIDVITAMIGVSIFSCIKVSSNKSEIANKSIYFEMKTGITYVVKNKVIKNLLMLYGFFTILCVPAGYFAGLYVSRIYGDTYWYLTAVEVIGFGGMMAGGLIMSLLPDKKNYENKLYMFFCMMGITSLGMGLSKSFFVYLVLMLLFGISITSIQTTITTMLQCRSSENMHGRIFGLMGSIYSGCYPLGMAIFGPLADCLSLRILVSVSGLLILVLLLIVFFINKILKCTERLQ